MTHKQLKRIAFVNFTDRKYNGYSLNKGMLYIATILRNDKYDVKVFQRNLLYLSPKWSQLYHSIPKFINKILKFKPDVIGITFETSYIVRDYIRYISMIKRKAPNVKIAVGGPHITATMGEIFNYAPVDFAFYGEAEESFPEFIKNYPKCNTLKGLIYRTNSKIIINPPVDPIMDLDTLPFPDYRLIFGIRGIENSIYFINYVVFSRGCQFSCNFCYTNRLFTTPSGIKVRYRSPENIVDEIEWNIKLNNVRLVCVGSETHTFNRKWVIDICKEIIRRGLKIELHANTRYDLVDDELLSIMKKAGYRILHIGFETGSKRILDMYNKNYRKNFRYKDYIRTNNLILKNGLVPRSYIMLGNPFENVLDTLKTLKLMLQIGVVHYPMTFDANPGTVFYEQGIKKGYVKKGWYLKKESTLKDNVGLINYLLINTIIFFWRNKIIKRVFIRLNLFKTRLSRKNIRYL